MAKRVAKPRAAGGEEEVVCAVVRQKKSHELDLRVEDEVVLNERFAWKGIW